MADAPVTSSGEHPNGRKAMDDLIRRQRESGVPYDTARRNAEKAARRHDTKNRS